MKITKMWNFMGCVFFAGIVICLGSLAMGLLHYFFGFGEVFFQYGIEVLIVGLLCMLVSLKWASKFDDDVQS